MTALRCLLGRHAPGPKPISNHGFRFSRCRRCGKDIVQTTIGGWHVPNKAFQIVWREQRVSATPSPAPAPVPETPVKAQPVSTPLPDFMAGDDDGFDWLTSSAAKSNPREANPDGRDTSRLSWKRF